MNEEGSDWELWEINVNQSATGDARSRERYWGVEATTRGGIVVPVVGS